MPSSGGSTTAPPDQGVAIGDDVWPLTHDDTAELLTGRPSPTTRYTSS